MAEDRGAVHTVLWRELFPSLALVSAVRLALRFRPLALAAMALVATTAGWRICGSLFGDADLPHAVQVEIVQNDRWPWQQARDNPSLQPVTAIDRWIVEGPLVRAWQQIARPFRQAYEAPSFAGAVYLTTCALWALLIWSFFGGAISRDAAVAIARQENVSWKNLSAFVRKRLGAYFTAPLFPLLGTLLIAIFLAVVGLLMRMDWGVLAAGVLWPLVLLGAFMMAFLLIVLYFAWPLMWGAISAEGTDAFGALSHSYSYTYQRPLLYLLYTMAAALLGLLGWVLVSIFSDWIILLSHWAVSWGSSGARLNEIFGAGADLGQPGGWGRNLLLFWENCVRTAGLAFAFSYLWTSTTTIYFLLRRHVDATEIDEVYMPDEPAIYGLPPLKTGPDGVPEVAGEPAASPERS